MKLKRGGFNRGGGPGKCAKGKSQKRKNTCQSAQAQGRASGIPEGEIRKGIYIKRSLSTGKLINFGDFEKDAGKNLTLPSREELWGGRVTRS